MMEDFGHALCADLPRVPCISVVCAFSFRKGAGWYIVDPVVLYLNVVLSMLACSMGRRWFVHIMV